MNKFERAENKWRNLFPMNPTQTTNRRFRRKFSSGLKKLSNPLDEYKFDLEKLK